MAHSESKKKESLPKYEGAKKTPDVAPIIKIKQITKAKSAKSAIRQPDVAMNNKSRCFVLKIIVQLICTFLLIALLFFYTGFCHVYYVKKRLKRVRKKEEIIIGGMSLNELRKYLGEQTYPDALDDEWFLESVEFIVCVNVTEWRLFQGYYSPNSRRPVLKICYDVNYCFALNDAEHKWLTKILESEHEYLDIILESAMSYRPGEHWISSHWGYHNVSSKSSALNAQWLLFFKWVYCKHKDSIPVPEIVEMDNGKECPVCYDEFKDGDVVSKICNATPAHWLCKRCAKQIKEDTQRPQPQCPCCRGTSPNGTEKKWKVRIKG